MLDIKKGQAFVVLFGLAAFLVLIDSQCYGMKDACLPDIGSYISAPNVVSDQSLLVKQLDQEHLHIEWKEKLGAEYILLFSRLITLSINQGADSGQFFFIILSKLITINYHTFPIISSILLLVVTYFFTLKITANRLVSVISVAILEFSKTFMWYSDSIPYPNFFMVFLLLSLYPFTKIYIKPITFILSFFMKAESLAFLPLVFIKEKNKKIRITYIMMLVLFGIVAISLNWVRFDGTINTTNALYPQIGLYLLDQDMWILASLFPVALLLCYLWHKKVEWASFLLISMGYCLLFQYILPIFTTYNAYGYRMLPFVVFFSISIGLIISKKEMFIQWKPKTAYQKEAYLYVSG